MEVATAANREIKNLIAKHAEDKAKKKQLKGQLRELASLRPLQPVQQVQIAPRQIEVEADIPEELRDVEILGDEDESPELTQMKMAKMNSTAIVAAVAPKITEFNSNLKDKSNSKTTGIPEDMLCILCLDKRKERMIQGCGHLVFCKGCEVTYNQKNPLKRECPICRKDYKKTNQVYYT